MNQSPVEPRNQRRQQHRRVARGQLRRFRMAVERAERAATVGVMIAVSLQVDQQRIGQPARVVPRMLIAHGLQLAARVSRPRQAIVFDVIRKLKGTSNNSFLGMQC